MNMICANGECTTTTPYNTDTHTQRWEMRQFSFQHKLRTIYVELWKRRKKD